MMPQMCIVNILPFFKPKQLKVLQHFLPIVAWRQGLDKDGKRCVVDPQWHGELWTVFKRFMKGTSEKQAHFQSTLTLGWRNRRSTEACKYKRLENCCL